jgi:hypothetical protein
VIFNAFFRPLANIGQKNIEQHICVDFTLVFENIVCFIVFQLFTKRHHIIDTQKASLGAKGLNEI